jgi:hypothetical protein
MKNSKFSYCFYSDGMIWCKYPSGKYAPPFPADKIKSPNDEDGDLIK